VASGEKRERQLAIRTKMTSPMLLLSACATPELANHFHNPNADAVADDTTKNTDNPAINRQLSALLGGGKNQSAGQMSLALGGDW
jgi:hypothetical protein